MENKQLAIILQHIVKRLEKAIEEGGKYMPEDAEKVQEFVSTGEITGKVFFGAPVFKQKRVDSEDFVAFEAIKEILKEVNHQIKILLNEENND